MAGDWIKMRGNLWDDPRVSALVDATDTSEAAVIGGLYWLWATADQHTEDGVMPGLTIRQIDRKTGIPGFGAALVVIGWIADNPDGIRIVNFEEHNGASAKKRCSTAKRVAGHRGGNADVTQQALQADDASVTAALAREEKRREEIEKEKTEEGEEDAPGGAPPPSMTGAICVAMKAVGLASVNPSHPDLQVLIDKGADIGVFVDAARQAVARQKPFSYVLAMVKGRMADAAALANTALAAPGQTGNPSLNKQQALEASNNAIAAKFIKDMNYAPQ